MTEPLSIEQIARVIDGRLLYAPVHPVYATSFSIDTRTLRPGDLFIAIKGKRFNGNDFVEKAFEKGACCAIVSRSRWLKRSDSELGPGPLIAASDTTVALARLAQYWRGKLKAKVIAVTGSVGKTATRQMIYHVLSKAGDAHCSPLNYNNIYGLSLSILSARSRCQYLILELGMSAPGEIAQLASISRPDLGVVTNVARCHTEFFDSLEQIADAKAELFGAIPPNGAIFLNADDKMLVNRSGLARCRVVWFGLSTGEFRARGAKVLGEGGVGFYAVHEGQSFPLRIPLLGTHNVYNALAAVAVARYVGLSWETIANGLLDANPLPHRLNLVKVKKLGLRIIDDTYNASPAAMRAAIDTVFELRQAEKSSDPVILVLADMLELGRIGAEEHYKIGRYIQTKGVERLLVLGPLSKQIGRGAADAGMPRTRIEEFETFDELISAVGRIGRGAWVLVKGSRRWKLERVVQRLCMQQGNASVQEEIVKAHGY